MSRHSENSITWEGYLYTTMNKANERITKYITATRKSAIMDRPQKMCYYGNILTNMQIYKCAIMDAPQQMCYYEHAFPRKFVWKQWVQTLQLYGAVISFVNTGRLVYSIR